MRKTLRKLVGALAAVSMLLSLPVTAFAAEASALNVLGSPSGIIQAGDGSLLVTDVFNNAVWSINQGNSQRYAGKSGVLDLYGSPVGGYRDGANAEALFSEPWAICPFLDGYAVSDTANNVVRYVTAEQTRTLCGDTKAGLKDGVGTQTEFNMPKGLAADSEGTLYIADSGNNCIRKLSTGGKVSTYVTGLNAPAGLCFLNGTLYVCEAGANRIVKIAGGKIQTVAGTGMPGYSDGTARNAQFSNPQGITAAPDGTLYVSDTGSAAVRKIKNNQVSTLLVADPVDMKLYPQEPRGLLVSGDQLYVCDAFSNKLIVIDR